MIRLEVEDYCQNCLIFDPDVLHPTQMFAEGVVAAQTDTIVRCERRECCENLKKYLQREFDTWFEKEELNGTVPPE